MDELGDFDAIVAGLEDELDIEDFTRWNNLELMDQILEIRTDLMDRGVALAPKTPEDIEKREQYYDLLAEARRRRLM